MSAFNSSCSVDFQTFAQKTFDKHVPVMQISIFVDSDDEELKNKYIDAANAHNKKFIDDPDFYDAGFDIYLPKYTWFTSACAKNPIPVNKVDFKIKCCAKIYHFSTKPECDKFPIPISITNTPFYTYARSSISKTGLRLANNQGIIDAGYRGNIIGMFDCIVPHNPDEFQPDWVEEKFSRLLQICGPSLMPIYVNIVNSLEELGPVTRRGEGGIGSTGK